MKKIFLFFLFLSIHSNYSLSKEVYITKFVDDQIILNIDIKNESEYLKILNPQLRQISPENLQTIALTSLINEIIKKKEIEKNLTKLNNNEFIQEYLENFALNLGFLNAEKLIDNIKLNTGYNTVQINQKINIELDWNRLISQKYNNKVNINKKKILDRINQQSDEVNKIFKLSEIIFKKKKDQPVEELIEEINLSIKEIGFNNTANIYSVSNSAKIGGAIGWVNQNSISDFILKNLIKLNKGDITNVFKTSNEYIIIKIEDIKEESKIVDKEAELTKIINLETNKQLNKFSRIHFDKIKLNYNIYNE